jgi:hypothetical protein
MPLEYTSTQALPRSAEKSAPTRLAAAPTRSARWKPEIKGSASSGERGCPVVPEKISNISRCGIAPATMEMARAMESTPPTLVRRVRVPLATPRSPGPTELMMERVLGELKIPLPAPTTAMSSAISQ